MKLPRVCRSLFWLSSLLRSPRSVHQELSKYRVFSLGTNLSTVLEHTDQKPEETKLHY